MSWKPQPSLHWLRRLSNRVSWNEVLLCWFLTSVFFLLFVDVFAVCSVVAASLSVMLSCPDPFYFSDEWSMLWIEQEMVIQIIVPKCSQVKTKIMWYLLKHSGLTRGCSVLLEVYSGKEGRKPTALQRGVLSKVNVLEVVGCFWTEINLYPDKSSSITKVIGSE